MANQLDKFDQLVKDSYAGYEAPYDPAHWEELEEELGIAAPGITTYFSAVTTGLVAVGLVFLSMLYFFPDSSMNQHNQQKDAPVVTLDNSGGDSAEASNSERSTEPSGSAENTLAKTGNTAESKADLKAAKTSKYSGKSNKAKHEPGKETSDNLKVAASNETNANAKVRTGCTGLVINFEAAKKYGEEAKYLWNFGDGFFSNDPNPSHTFNKEGVFDVSLSVTSKMTGQISSNVVQAMIEVVEAPVANLDITIENPENISVKNESYNASALEWVVDGEKMVNKSEIELSIPDNTRYTLSLNAMNDGGCTDTLDCVIKSVTAGNEFPKAMDQTSGHNFAPGAIVDSGKVSSIKIFNKSTDELVFEGFGNKGWNGTTLAGKSATKGTYRWLMAVKKSDTVDIYKGDIELR